MTKISDPVQSDIDSWQGYQTRIDLVSRKQAGVSDLSQSDTKKANKGNRSRPIRYLELTDIIQRIDDTKSVTSVSDPSRSDTDNCADTFEGRYQTKDIGQSVPMYF